MAFSFSSSGSGGSTSLGYNPIYGGRPTVPTATSAAASATEGNLANLKNLELLAKAVNDIQLASQIANRETAIPGYNEMTAQSSRNISSQLAGEVAPDVLNQIIQGAAERGIMSGTPLSANSGASYLKALGLTSASLQQQGETNLTNAIGRAPSVAPFDFTQLFTTPEQQYESILTGNIYASAPDPTAAGQHAEELFREQQAAAQTAPASSWGSSQASNPISGTWFTPKGGSSYIPGLGTYYA